MARERSVDAGAFVGRSATVRLAASIIVRRRTDGRTRSVVLAGETGVGKSRLADEVSATVAAHGVDVAVVRVTPSMSAVPLGALATVVPVAERDHGRRADLLVAVAERLESAPDRLLLVDDAHLLDSTSAAVLHLAASRSRLRFLLTVRSGEPVDPAVASLWKDDLAERIDVGPLDRDETAALAAALLGAPLDGVGLARLWEVSRGNALFVRELLIGALDEGLVVDAGHVVRFTAPPRSSARLAEIIGARLADLELEQREALEVLAVGGELGLASLRELVSERLLIDLERRRLIEVGVDGRRFPVRLAHPLHGELLREQMGKVRQMAVYRLLADRLERHGARRRNDVLDLARWRMLGGGATRPDLLLDASRQALFRFDALLAHELAVLGRRHGVGVEADVLAAEALEQQGRHAEAAVVLADALERVSDDEARVRAATALSVIQFWTFGDEALAQRTVREAIARLDEPALADQLDAHAASFAAMANRPQEALERTAAFLAPGSPRARGRAFTVAAVAAGPSLTVVGRSLDALELVERCLPVRLELGDDEALPDAFKYTMAEVFARSEAGDLDAAIASIRETYTMVTELRAIPAVAWAAMLRGRTALMVGDLALAVASCGEAAELFEDLDEQGLRAWSLAGVVMAMAMGGRGVAAAEQLAVLAAIDPGPVVAMQADLDRAVAWSRRAGGDPRGAVDVLERALADADERGAWGMSVSLLHDLVRVGGADLAGRVRPEHRAVQGRLADARLDLVDAVLASDTEALEACTDRFAALGSPVFAAETASLAAAAHRRVGSARRAATCLGRSRDLAATCPGAATPLLGAVAAMVELTQRERDVAELAAAGHTSREIAERLDRSVRTVENHLQRVYDKLGVGGRGELVEVLARTVPPWADPVVPPSTS